MITGIPGLLLNSFSIIVLSAVAMIALISLAHTCRWIPLHTLSAEARQTGLWILAGAPWIVGTIAAAIVMTVSIPAVAQFIGSQLIHWHHPETFTLASWHGYFVLLMLGFALCMALQVALHLHKAATTIRTLSNMASTEQDGVRILDTDAPAAFTAGMVRPHCFMTTALVAQLSADEYAIIRLHELAHVERLDPIRKTLFHFLTAIFPPAVSHSLNQSMITAMEQIADAAVCRTYQDKAAIARTLLKVQRLVMHNIYGKIPLSAVCHYGMEAIDQRIRYLLAAQKGQSIPVPLVMLLLAVLSIVCAFGVDSIHHIVEVSLHHA